MKKKDILRTFLNLNTLYLGSNVFNSMCCSTPIKMRKGVPTGLYTISKVFKECKDGIRYKLIGVHETGEPYTLVNVVVKEGELVTYPYTNKPDLKKVTSEVFDTMGLTRRLMLRNKYSLFADKPDLQFPVNLRVMKDLRVEYEEYPSETERNLFSMLVGEYNGRTYRIAIDHVTVIRKGA